VTRAVQRLGPPEAQEAITTEREETKYLLLADRFDTVATELSRRLPSHRFTGEGANALPGPHHFVTTIYFDTPTRSHFRAASANFESNVKIRAKEYYDLHPSLAELATDPAQIVRYQPWLWFELKRRDGTRTWKHRFRLPKQDVPAFFGEGQVTPDAIALTKAAPNAPGSDENLREVVDYCRSLDEPLSATCLVNYRRLSWQAPDGELRVTMDLGLAFYAVPSDLWTRRQALVRSTLGRAVASEANVVLEIKRRAAMPAWLDESLERARVRAIPFSKFVAASRSVGGT
jgi:hypothetical protein